MSEYLAKTKLEKMKTREVCFPAEDLWELQCFLLEEAENLLGPRDPSFTIYQPVYSPEVGPNIRFNENKSGVFVELHKNATCYWPTLVYQMAHETIHLLDPRPGPSTCLEEAFAVEFSLFMQNKLGHSMYMPSGKYYEVWRLMHLLGRHPFVVGKRIRENCETFHTNDLRKMIKLFPHIRLLDKSILPELISEF